jgi:hypothetical protein
MGIVYYAGLVVGYDERELDLDGMATEEYENTPHDWWDELGLTYRWNGFVGIYIAKTGLFSSVTEIPWTAATRREIDAAFEKCEAVTGKKPKLRLLWWRS